MDTYPPERPVAVDETNMILPPLRSGRKPGKSQPSGTTHSNGGKGFENAVLTDSLLCHAEQTKIQIENKSYQALAQPKKKATIDRAI